MAYIEGRLHSSKINNKDRGAKNYCYINTEPTYCEFLQGFIAIKG